MGGRVVVAGCGLDVTLALGLAGRSTATTTITTRAAGSVNAKDRRLEQQHPSPAKRRRYEQRAREGCRTGSLGQLEVIVEHSTRRSDSTRPSVSVTPLLNRVQGVISTRSQTPASTGGPGQASLPASMQSHRLALMRALHLHYSQPMPPMPPPPAIKHARAASAARRAQRT